MTTGKLRSEQFPPVHPDGHMQVFGAAQMWLLSQLWQTAESEKIHVYHFHGRHISKGLKKTYVQNSLFLSTLKDIRRCLVLYKCGCCHSCGR